MLSNSSILKRGLSDQEWIDQSYNTSKSINSKRLAATIINYFNKFNLAKYPGVSNETIVEELKKDHEGLYTYLNDFIQYISQQVTPSSASVYYAYFKSYLRSKGVRISNEDAKGIVRLPKVVEQERFPLTTNLINTILFYSNAEHKAIYLFMASSGCRIRETIQIKKSDILILDNTVAVNLRGETTKTKKPRQVFMSAEAWSAVKPIYDSKDADDYIFIKQYHEKSAVQNQELYFKDVRKRCSQKDPIFAKKFEGLDRYLVNIHGFRAFFFTKASDIHGLSYAHAITGHKKYLDQYYRKTPEEKAQMYKKLEPHVTISNELRHEAKIKEQAEQIQKQKSMESEIEKLKAALARLERKR